MEVSSEGRRTVGPATTQGDHRPTIGAELEAIRLDVQFSTRRIAALPSSDRWDLEETANTIRDVVRTVNDDELRRWAKEGKTQTWIAQRVGRTQAAISQRCTRLGLRFDTGKGTKGGRPRKPEAEVISPNNSAPAAPTDEPDELVTGEVVGPTPIRPTAGKIPCPTCGHPVEVSVLTGE